METNAEITAGELAAIRRLVAIDGYEIKHFSEETRLRFNALAEVRVFVLAVRVGDREGELELFHWVGSDEWELVHSTFGS